MRTLVAIPVVLMMVSVGRGQQPQNCTSGMWIDGKWTCPVAEKAIQQPAPQVVPLKCGKYQHVVKGAGQCFDDAEGKKPNPAGFWCATESFPAHCADDMHMVTEREWQELQIQIRHFEKLYESVCVGEKTGTLFNCDKALESRRPKESGK